MSKCRHINFWMSHAKYETICTDCNGIFPYTMGLDLNKFDWLDSHRFKRKDIGDMEGMKNKFLKLHDIKQLTKISGSKVYKLVESNQFPKPVKIGKRSTRWLRDEINEWVKDKTETDREVEMKFYDKPVEVKEENEAQKVHEAHDKARKALDESGVHLGDFIENILDRTIHVYKQSDGYSYPFVELYPKHMSVRVRYMGLQIDYAPGGGALIEGPKGTRITISERFDLQQLIVGLAAALNSWKMLDIVEKEKKSDTGANKC